MERKVIVIVGPTCSGKTELALKLAVKLNTEIISADSRQVFKYLDIGTAKPDKKITEKIKHHFIDELLPTEDFNVSKYEVNGLEIISKIHNQDKIPIVVGGSGLYVKALVDGIFQTVDSDDNFRNEMLKKKNEFGIDFLYNELKKVDSESASKMFPQNWKRVIRALEVYHLTGKTISEFQKNYKRSDDNIFIQLGLEWDREILYKNIEARVDDMIAQGLVNEVKFILMNYKIENLNSLNTVGYKELISYLNNEIELNKAIELIKRNTRHFAKRQMTWFKKDKRIEWIKVNSINDFEKITNLILKRIA